MDKFFFKIALVNHLYFVLCIINGLYALFLLDIFKAYKSTHSARLLLNTFSKTDAVRDAIFNTPDNITMLEIKKKEIFSKWS